MTMIYLKLINSKTEFVILDSPKDVDKVAESTVSRAIFNNAMVTQTAASLIISC